MTASTKISIIASLVWILIGGYSGYQIGLQSGASTFAQYASCYKRAKNSSDYTDDAQMRLALADCERLHELAFEAATRNRWYWAACFALVPLLAGWVGGLVGSRWGH